jgi:2,3,4,5-tetrahydropyridine-2-carboxylate N-succinyltransferase
MTEAETVDLREPIEAGFALLPTTDTEGLVARCGAAVEAVLDRLESGALRVAEPDGQGGWQVNDWVKKAVLLYFRLRAMAPMPADHAGLFGGFDKVPLRFAGDTAVDDYRAAGARVVPGAIVRRGAHVGRDVVLMPSFVNIGAHVGPGTMVDTWATVGSCAQIGRNVHLSGGAGIGGVLEPLQATPTIIEDDCFIGARSEVVEGVIVERGSVIGMGVFLGQSTRIYDRASGRVHYGRVPAGSVIVPGSLPSADGSYSLNCAVIVKRVDERTRSKTALNEILRQAAEEA